MAEERHFLFRAQAPTTIINHYPLKSTKPATVSNPTSEGREQSNAPASTEDESLSAVQRVAETIPGVVTLFATFALLLYVCCLFAGTDALLMSAREESDTAAIRYTQAIALFQGLVLLVVFIAGFSIFVSYVSGS